MQFKIMPVDIEVDACDVCGRVYNPCGAIAIVGEIHGHVCEICLARSPVKVVISGFEYLARRRAEFDRQEAAAAVFITELQSATADEWQRIATARGLATAGEPIEPIEHCTEPDGQGFPF